VEPSPAPAPAPASSGLVCALALAALVAGTLDYTAAITNFLLKGGKDPTLIAWYIASSLLGREAAYAGGWVTATFGIFLHYVIATSWTVLFFLGYPRIALLRKNALLVGAVYGLFVWTMMNLVLVPLTCIKPGAFNLANAATQAGILVVCIGLPISLLAHRHYGKKQSA